MGVCVHINLCNDANSQVLAEICSTLPKRIFSRVIDVLGLLCPKGEPHVTVK